MNDNLKTAQAFASLLDKKDFESAKSYLASFCEYKIGGETLHGPNAIVSSYESNSVKAKGLFDSITYESGLTQTSADQIEIIYTDILTKGGKVHHYRTKQLLNFDPKGEIIEITHVQLEGEQDRLKAFEREIGLPAAT